MPFIILLLAGFTHVHAQDTLSLWVLGSPNDGMVQFLDTTLGQFQDETGLAVEYEFVPWGDAVERITTAVISGEGPDITQVGTTRVASFQATGGFVELSGDFGGVLPPEEAFLPSALQTRGYAGEAYAMPWYSDPWVMIYRRDLWEAAGYPEGPRTWQELRQGASAILEAHPELDSVIGLPGQAFGHYLGDFIWQNCGDVISPDGQEVTWTAPEVAGAVEFVADLITEDGTVAPQNAEWTDNDVLTRLWEGEVATVIFGSEYNRVATDEQRTALGDELGFAPAPAGPCAANFVGGSNLMIF